MQESHFRRDRTFAAVAFFAAVTAIGYPIGMFSQGSPHVRLELAAARLRVMVRLVVGAALFGGLVAPCVAEPFPIAALPGDDISGNLPGGYEPSGAVWHTRLERLFTVHDNGVVSYLDENGTDVNNWTVAGDLEAIAVADTDSDFVYVGVERPDSVMEFNITSGLVTRTFDLTTWMTGPQNRGLEALTFVPDAADLEGGLFYAGLQDDGKIYTFRLPIASSATSTAVTHVSTITPVVGRDDLSGLHFDVEHQRLYAVFDGDDKIRAMDANGTLRTEWDLPGDAQEGVTLAGTTLFIAEDSGDVLKYTDFLMLPVLGDFDGDGNVTIADAPLLVEALTNRAAYDAHEFGVDADTIGDINGDGTFDLGDSGPLSALLGGPASANAVPEPSAMLLADLSHLGFA